MPSRIRIQNELVLRDRNVGIGSTLPASKLSITQSSNSQALDIGSQLRVDGSGVFNPSITIGSTVGAADTGKVIIGAVSRENGLLEIENVGGNQLFSVSNDQSGDLFGVYRYYNFTNLPIPVFQNRKMFSISNAGDVFILNNVTGLGTFRLGNVGTASSIFNEIHSSLVLRPGFSTSITQSVYIVPKISDRGAISFEAPIGTAQTNRGNQVFSISNNFDTTIFRVNDLNRNPILEATTTGNIGIGTNNPAQKLQVIGATRISSVGSTAGEQIDIRHYRNIAYPVGVGTTIIDNKGAISFDSPLGISVPGVGIFPASLFAITNDPTGNVFSVAGYDFKKFASNPQTPALDVTQSGNVGVGTTIPRAKFEVNGQTLLAVGTGNVGIGTASPKRKLELTDILRISSSGSTSAQEIDIRQIKGTGTGIGSTSPPVRGAIFFDGEFDTSLNGGQLISVVNDNTNSLFTINRYLGLTSTSYAPAGQRNLEPVIDVKSTGNIGIGTFTPLTRLDVRGNVNISGISTVGLGTTSSPTNNSTMSFELTDNTTLTVRVRGTDGVIRTGIVSLS